MKVDTGASYLFASQRSLAPARADARDFASMLPTDALRAASAGEAESRKPDFTNMTRQELGDWVNDQIRSGEMSLDESSAFLAIGGLVYIGPGGPGIAEERIRNERVNFFEIAGNGIDFYRLRGDHEAAARLQAVLDIMHRAQDADFRI